MPEFVTSLVSHPLQLLAQATTAPAGQQPPNPLSSLLMLFVPMGLIYYFLILRPQSADKKKRADLLAGIKKNDRVCTIGGIYGTVVNVKDDEITLKVDESNNTKITFTRSAIARILRGEATPPAENGGAPAKK